MESLFGIPTDALAVALAIAVGLALAALAAVGARRPVLARIGLRNLPRRPLRALLISGGMSLSTAIIASSFVAGDTLSHTIRTVAVGSLGDVDEALVGFRGADSISPAQLAGIASGQAAALVSDDFNFDEYTRLRDLTRDDRRIAGLAPAITELMPVADETTHRALAGLIVLALPSDFPPPLGRLAFPDGTPAPLEALAADEVYLSRAAAEAYGASPGDALAVQRNNAALPLRVAGVLRDAGPAGLQPALILPLDHYQALTARGTRINEILVANAGDADRRYALSGEVSDALREVWGEYEEPPVF